MVNEKRVRKKLPSLLVDGETTDPKIWAEYMNASRKITTLKKREPTRFRGLMRTVVKALEEFDRALNEELDFSK